MNSNSLPFTFSKKVSNILQEVESLYGFDVWWEERADLEGSMCAIRNIVFPTVLFKSEAVLNEGSCVHELLHLKLCKLGFPNVEKVDHNENNAWRDQTAAMINNIFEHHIIFPKLIELGYSPYESEEEATKKQLLQLSKIYLPSSNYKISLKSIASLIYARSYLDCISDDIRSLCESIISKPHYQSCKGIGIKVIDIVKHYAVEDAHQFRQGLENCIEVLQENEFIRVERKNGS